MKKINEIFTVYREKVIVLVLLLFSFVSLDAI